MPAGYAAACGGIVGCLFSFIIALIYDMGIADAAYRLLVLTISGAWMGTILAKLNGLLSPASVDVNSGKYQNPPS